MSFLKISVLCLLVLLGACGFEPLYKDSSTPQEQTIAQEMAQVKIEPIANRFGQLLRNNLLDLVTPKGQPQTPKYRLYVTLTRKSIEDQALRSDITATRKKTTYKVSYYMVENGKKVLVGNSVAYSGFDILANPYSTTMAQKKDDENAAKIIAEDISLRLGAYFHHSNGKKGETNDI